MAEVTAELVAEMKRGLPMACESKDECMETGCNCLANIMPDGFDCGCFGKDCDCR